jgi:uncharacterized protein (TIGR03435 family)
MSRKLMGFALAMTLAVAAEPEFDVASIKLANPSAPQPGRLANMKGIIQTRPGLLSTRSATLKELIEGAFSLENYQVTGGPQWVDSARFEVQGKPATGASRKQLLSMLQLLLADRFKLAFHRETKELPIYALVAVKSGPKFRPLAANEAPCWPACAGQAGVLNHLRQSDLPTLASYLTRLGADRPVIDKTGLTGNFALDLNMERIMAAVPQESAIPMNQRIFAATVDDMQDELGLRLVPAMAPVEILTIDHVERPTEN